MIWSKKLKIFWSVLKQLVELINRKQILNIATEVVRANDKNALEEYGRTLHLTDRQAEHVLVKIKWTKRKGITRRLSPPFLVEEKFTFERLIFPLVLKRDIPSSLLKNLDHTPLSYIYQENYTFSFKGAKNVSMSQRPDKSQITKTFVVTFIA